ncbi:rod shape-determining protein MreC [Helicobacter muridarum]|uniref:Rod shape-determining protein n=1 Tax=Helicobacter muridarum TaxID=216 RepID=A0A099TWV1_9HELI|nr:rod shape-determining protein MreC [Helicobacter muridarum]TLD99560.1 rod shape-determining protein MreC [Helicobacter muridarum]STQ85898.1 rod shape-determining protein [Helicobacter muridarum]
MRTMFIYISILIALFMMIGFIPALREYAINVSFGIKEFYLEKQQNITLFIDDHINQANQIKKMREQVIDLEKLSIEYKALYSDFDNLRYSLDIEKHYEDPDVNLVKVLSYANLGSYTKIWILYNQEKDPRKIFGIVKDGYAIGIAKVVNNHLLGLLNGDQDCSYSVYIGENRVPGTVRTLSDGSIVVDYIPAWQSIKSGDRVVTSGLDGIFFEKVDVGVIDNIQLQEAYLRAELKPYSFSNRLNYVWLIDTKIPQITRLNPDYTTQDYK